jgi:hypothetical protein
MRAIALSISLIGSGPRGASCFIPLVANPKTVANFAENLFVHRSF